MTNKEIPEPFKEELARALKDKAVLGERSKLLKKQIEDYRGREQMMQHLASELLERQRELNYMLHRASSVLHQLQDANLALSTEFTHMVKELPPAKDGNWENTIDRVNQLFKKTHELAGDLQDEIFHKSAKPEPAKKPAGKTAKEPVAEAPPVSEPMPEPPQPEVVMAEAEIPPTYDLGPEPEMEALLPPPIYEPQPEPEVVMAAPEAEIFEPEIVADLELQESEPIAFGESVAVEEPVVETLAEAEVEEPAVLYPTLHHPNDGQIERLFRQIQPIELKPPPNRRALSGRHNRLLSKLFRKNKIAA